jgi:multiple sugar transport system ATP-binding protein
VLAAKSGLRAYANRSVVVGIRPEDLPISTEAESTDGASFEGNVDLVEALGSEQLVHFTSDAHQIQLTAVKDDDAEGLSEGALAKAGEGVARVDARAKLTVGGRVRFNLDPSRIHFFDEATSEAIAN